MSISLNDPKEIVIPDIRTNHFGNDDLSSIKVSAEIYLGTKDDDGADGMALVFQAKDNHIVGTGSGIGYQGMSPSIAIEFDTDQNLDENKDPVADHVGLRTDGDPIHAGTDMWTSGTSKMVNTIRSRSTGMPIRRPLI